jgi:hypothetical protein
LISAVARASGPFSCFGGPDSISAVARASGPFFMFRAPELVFEGTEGVGSIFNDLRSRTCFRRYRCGRVMSSYFARPDSFTAVPRASGHVFKFCVPRLIFGDIEGDGSRFHVLRSRTSFWRYRGCRVLFLCFAGPDSFSRVPRASGPIFIFFLPGLVFGGSEGVWSRFHVLRAWTRFRRSRGRRIPF